MTTFIAKLRLFIILCCVHAYTAVDIECSIYNINVADDEVDQVCLKAFNDPRTHVQTFNTSFTSFIVVGIGGFLSLISSSIIILFILRSEIGLSSMYHRIMFMLCIGDVLGSSGMMLSTIPMPKQDMIYDFAGPSYGNDFTCNIQGTLVWMGLSLSTFYSTSGLPLFYLCMIKYKMEESEIKKFIEPVIHTIIFLFSVPAPFLMWYNGRYHPTPLEPWCTAVAYPWHCLLNEGNPEECMLKGSITPFAKRSREILVYFYCFSYFTTIGTLFVCMLYIMCTFYEGTAGHNIRRSFSDRVSSANPNRIESLRQKSHLHTRFMIRIALAYIFASTITIGSTILHAGEGSLLQTAPYITQSRLLLQFIHALLIPLQGFFNVLIFSALKIYEYRQVHPGNSIKDVILKLLMNREEQLYFISRMSLINDIEMMDDDNFEDEDAIFSYTDFDKTSKAYSKKLLKELEMISYGDANSSSPGQRTKVEEQSAKKSVPTSSKYGSWLSRVPSDLSYSISGRVSSEGVNSVDNLVSLQGGGLPSNGSVSSQGGGLQSNETLPLQEGGPQK